MAGGSNARLSLRKLSKHPPRHFPNPMKSYSKHTVTISRQGDVTLRTPAGRSVGFYGGSRKDPDAAAADFLATFPGASLVDKRRSLPADK